MSKHFKALCTAVREATETYALLHQPVKIPPGIFGNILQIICEENRIKAKKNLETALNTLQIEIEKALQNPPYPCDKLPPVPVKPPESLIDGTVLAALFALYAACIRLTNPEDLGHQLQPEARQLINDAINKVRHTCEQPTVDNSHENT